MTNKDLSSLTDVYRVLEQPDSLKQTSCILQFLWWDLTSNYYIVCPHYTCSESVNGKFIHVSLKPSSYFKLIGWRQVYLSVMVVLLIYQLSNSAMDMVEPILCYLQTARVASMLSSPSFLTHMTNQTSSTGWYVPHTSHLLYKALIVVFFYSWKTWLMPCFLLFFQEWWYQTLWQRSM